MIKKLNKRLMSVFITVIFILTSSPFVVAAEGSPQQKTKTKRTIVKELVEKRNENQKVFLNSDGTYTADIYSGPINYKNGDKYDEIDNSLVKSNVGSTDKDVIYKNKANSFNTYFDENLNSQQPVKLQFGKYNIGLKPVFSQNNITNFKTELIGKGIENKKLNGQKSVLISSGNLQSDIVKEFSNRSKKSNKNTDDIETTYQAIEYDNVYSDDISLQYMPASNGIKENIILNSYNGINKFNFNLILNG